MSPSIDVSSIQSLYPSTRVFQSVAFTGQYPDLGGTDSIPLNFAKWGSTSSSSVSVSVNGIAFNYQNGTLFASSTDTKVFGVQYLTYELKTLSQSETNIVSLSVTSAGSVHIITFWPCTVGNSDVFQVVIIFDVTRIPFLRVSWLRSFTS